MSSMRLLFENHPDFVVLSVPTAFSHIFDEIVEFVQSPSLDEWSDVMFGIGRLLGAAAGVKYISVWGDTEHVKKCNARFVEYGHFRSQRHL